MVSEQLDRDYLESMVESVGREFLLLLLTKFREDEVAKIDALESLTATADGDDSWRKTAHSICSTSRTMGAAELAALAKTIETLTEGTMPEARAELVSQVRPCFEAATEALEAYLSDG